MLNKRLVAHRLLQLAFFVTAGLALTVGCSDDPDSGGGSAGATADAGGIGGSICAATEDCPCANDQQCESGVCIEGPDGEKKCGKPCGDACPTGWQCKNFSTPAKAIFVCVPSGTPDCVPTVEECDGVDNDCDGQTDETFCDDGNPCTDDVCDPALAVDGSKGCTAVDLDVPCDDGDLCTENDQCKGGVCQDGEAKTCDDFNDCTVDSCSDLSGECSNTVASGPCSDSSACTVGDICDGGVCQPGAPLECDDNNPCTDDACDPVAGCQNADNTAKCEDGDLCTIGDVCADGTCQGASSVDCDDSNGCTNNFCDPALVSDLSDGCTLTWVTDSCDDGDACTFGDACKGGECEAGSAKNCDDNNSCTQDSCDETGGCINKVNPQDLNCDDGNTCTSDDKCTHDGKCVGVGPSCDDNEPCTVDGCDANTGKCTHENNSGATCSDGNNCTLGDSCVQGKCVASSKKLCDDGATCTDDACDEKDGNCNFVNNTAACNDSNPCTLNDTCAGGACIGLAQASTACSDGNGCTVDSCDPATGKCANKATANGVLCADANNCTQGDSCQKGVCTAGPAVYCDDNNACTDDKCDPTTGTCDHKPNNAGCDDDNKCTSDDQCSNGKCVSGKNACECLKDADCASKEDGNACNGTLFCEPGTNNCQVNSSTIAVCDKSKDTECATFSCAPKSGVCEATPNKEGIPCDADGSVCSNGDACAAGVCTPGAKVVCDDFNPCTDDKCDAKKGCENTNNSAGCFDGDHCTANDVCVAGACKAGKAVDTCSDDDPCTGDKCNPVTGNCQFPPLSGPGCTDSNACTTGDVCVAGGCQPTGSKPPCNDNNPCTIDSCNTKTGNCVAAPGFDGLGCDDGNQCSNGDYCQAGKCQSGSVSGCFGGGACQTGKCDVATGKCLYTSTNENGKCSDGDACSLEDICKSGKCVPKDNKPCNDNNVCTVDACNKITGQCEYKPGTDGLSCTDGNQCTQGDACTSGKCTAKSTTQCNDNNKCTKDSCNKSTGKCVHNAAPLLPYILCDDNNKCTRSAHYYNKTGKVGDVCYQGKCFGNAISCNDGNPCTADKCAPDKGCQHTKLGNVACSDGNACTIGDNCSSGSCKGTGKTCNDGNPCTSNICHTTKGCQFPGHSGGCNDGNVCTTTDRCKGGKCTGANAKDCNDGIPCTKDSCHPKQGCSSVQDDTLACSDSEPCTTGDKCSGGKCAPGGPTVCNDNNTCTTDSCSAGVGCVYKDVGDKPCDDGNVCTNPDACKDGKCHSTGLNKCDDGNECTTDSCHPQNGCQNVNFNGTCSDGDACTQGDFCKDGKCLVAGPLSCDDNNVCTTDTCDKADGCKHEATTGTSDAKLALGSDVQTKTYTKTKSFDGKDVPADIENAVIADTTHGKWKANIVGSSWIWRTKTVVAPTADTTVHFVREFSIPVDAKDIKASLQVTADDGFACTVNGKSGPSGNYSDAPATSDITALVAVGQNAVVCSVQNKGVAGATASSNPAGLLFRIGLDFKLSKPQCDDGNKCTALDTCEVGLCVGSNGLNCNDGNGCTTDTCDPNSGCVHKAATGADCDDGDDCTLGDACQGTKCVAAKTNSCDDGNICTDDSCKTIGGCQNDEKKFGAKQSLALVSSTATLVSTDKTVGANGLPVPKNLKPAVKFSAPLADWTQISGATWIWHSASLADPTKSETAYFQQDFKVADKGETLRGTLTIAADNAFECFLNGKLIGVTPQNGDAYKSAEKLPLGSGLKTGDNRLICSVYNIGKVGDTAKSNAAGMIWKIEVEWYKAGESPTCNDGNSCTKDDGCIFGFCLGGSPDNCDDDNACTADSCDTKAGCAHKTADNNACNDGSVCTQGDHCKNGQCAGKSQISCDDGNGCTEDKCHAESGCFGEPKSDGDACDDGSVCTKDTSCNKGECKNGKPTDCDDQNPCTADTCFPQVGCKFQPADNNSCNDGDSCTQDDLCKNGKCLGKTGNSCDDGNSCTADTCTKDKGCTHGPATGALCDDGNACTQNDKCDNGVCNSGKNKDCFDTQQCTVDACDAKTGSCTFSPVNDGECDDGNLCTLNDKCKSGKCFAGSAPGCSDGNTCTTDNCNPADGKCVHDGVNNGVGCNDGNACTLGDVCTDLKCGGGDKDCDDHNECTSDTCDPATGICAHSALADGATCEVVGKCKSGACLIK